MNAEKTHPDAAESLTELIAFDANDRALWPLEELRRAQRRHLASPLLETLAGAPVERSRLRAMALCAQPPVRSLGQLLEHPRPPLNLLNLIKFWARLHRDDPHSEIPPDIATILYWAAIAVALVRCAQRITRLSEDDLRCGFNWAARHAWLDEMLRTLFLDALAHLRSPRNNWRN